jgi:hypothetical protein
MTVKVSKPAINVREELADLRKPTGIAGEAMLRAETPQEQFNLIGAGRRNFIINGNFAVTQRGDYSSSTSVASGAYSIDRWKSNDPFNLQRFTGQVIDGIRTNYVKVSYNGTASMGFMQLIEDKDYEVLRGQTITISAYVRTNQALFGFRLYDGSQKYGPRFVADGNWHRATWTFTWSPSSPSYFQILFDTYQGSFPTIGSGDYMDIAMVQVELGKVATPFEHRSYGEELALAQRFYTRLGNDDGGFTHLMVGSAEGAGVYVVSRSLSTRMRAVPTLTVGSGVNGYTSSAGVASVNSFNTRCSRDIACISANVTGTATLGQAAVLYDAGANGYIELDAEL